LDDKQIQEIIDFINAKYDEEVPRPVKCGQKKSKEDRKDRSKRFPRII